MISLIQSFNLALKCSRCSGLQCSELEVDYVYSFVINRLEEIFYLN